MLVRELDEGVSFLMNNHKIATVNFAGHDTYELRHKIKIADEVLVVHDISRVSNQNNSVTLHKPIGKK